MEKVVYTSVCPRCKSIRTGKVVKGGELIRYCCGKEIKASVRPTN